MKNVLILHGNPVKDNSLTTALVSAYAAGAKAAGATVSIVYLIDLQFDPILRGGYTHKMPMEPDLLRVQEQIQAADHLVWVYPIWWGAMPALVKGFIDRVLMPGFAFKYRKDSPMWDKLLAGKSARVIVTQDTPVPFYWFWGRPNYNQMKNTILGFCGLKPVKFTTFAPVRGSSAEKRAGWIQQVETLGRALK